MKQLLYNLSSLAQEHYKLSSDLYMIEIVRQKMEHRGYQSFDKEDIMGELGKIQARLNDINTKLQNVAISLKAMPS